MATGDYVQLDQLNCNGGNPIHHDLPNGTSVETYVVGGKITAVGGTVHGVIVEPTALNSAPSGFAQQATKDKHACKM